MVSRPPRSKAGVTLLEVMIAGVMMSILMLTLLEGFTLATKICHENAEMLRADNLAFDLLWRKFYQDYESQLAQTETREDPPFTGTSTTERQTSDTTSPYRTSATTMTTWPTYADGGRQVPYKYREIVGKIKDGRPGKWLGLQVKYGPSYSRTHNLAVFRCEIPRVIPSSSGQ